MRKFSLALLAVLSLLLGATRDVSAAQLTLAWDPNTEPDIAGYIVEWGTPAAPYANSVDVGNATSWTLTTAVEGTTYSFRVIAYNTARDKSDPSAPVSETVAPSPGPSPGAGPTLSLERTYLNFGAVRTGGAVTSLTKTQTVALAQQGVGTMTWSVAPNQPWLQIAPSSGSGSALLSVGINMAAAPASGDVDGTLTVTSPQASNSPQVVTVHLRQIITSTPPSGAFDTPTDNSTGIAGAIAVTGWALDDVGVESVGIWRDPVTGESPAANGKIYIGNAVFVSGARPDVENAATAMPLNYRAGWGYLLLTNALPPSGNGTFTLYAYATDAEGKQALLGSKRITVSNATSIAPFGTLDTPGQGETIAGAAYASFGWALSPRSTIPVDGSTITVYIDGVNQGHPAYNQYRSDIATAFPGYANSTGAIGAFVIDTTKLTNGVHTIGWLATDVAGNSQGLGSRFFTVMNGGAPAVTATRSGLTALAIAEGPVANQLVDVRRPAEPGASEIATPDIFGRVTLRANELEQMELRLDEYTAVLGGTYEGYLAAGGELRPLPAGSTLDAARGIFTWQPAAGYLGVYDFIFVRTDAAGSKARIPVRLQIKPKRRDDPR